MSEDPVVLAATATTALKAPLAARVAAVLFFADYLLYLIVFSAVAPVLLMFISETEPLYMLPIPTEAIGAVLGALAWLYLAYRTVRFPAGTVRRVLKSFILVPLSIALLLALMNHAWSFMKLRTTREYEVRAVESRAEAVREANFSFELPPRWTAERDFWAVCWSPLGGCWNDPHRQMEIIHLALPVSEDGRRANAASVQLLNGNAVIKQALGSIRSWDFVVDGVSGIKQVARYADGRAISQYLFYLPQVDMTAEFRYDQKPGKRPLHAQFEKLVRSTDF